MKGGWLGKSTNERVTYRLRGVATHHENGGPEPASLRKSELAIRARSYQTKKGYLS